MVHRIRMPGYRIKYYEQTLSGSVVPNRTETIEVLHLINRKCLFRENCIMVNSIRYSKRVQSWKELIYSDLPCSIDVVIYFLYLNHVCSGKVTTFMCRLTCDIETTYSVWCCLYS